MKKRVVLYVLLAGVLIGAGIGLYLWNRPHPKAEDQQGIPVTSGVLFGEFSANETAANSKYLNKLVEVTGKIASLDTNQDSRVALILETSDPMYGIMCTMRDKDVKAAAGSTVTVKGFCSGYVSDVKLTDCILK